MNTWSIAGRIGKDAEIRRTTNGKAVAGFSVAVDQRKGQEKTTLWVDCSLWGPRGEALAQHLTKGSVVAVAGELSTHENNGKTYLKLDVRDISLHGGQSRERTGGSDAPTQAPSRGATDDEFGDSIPFLTRNSIY